METVKKIKDYLINVAAFASTEEEKRIITDILNIIKKNEKKDVD